MQEDIPITQRILDAAEVVLRRHGAEKANVVDVARVLGMSHSNIYRYFPSKQALINAVAVRWLHAVSLPLEVIAEDGTRPAAERLAAWFDTLRAIKKRKVLDDPEMFRVHHNIVEHAQDVVSEHIAAMLAQIERIIVDGIASGEFTTRLPPPTAARAFLYATSAFHHPALLLQMPAPPEEAAQAVLTLLLAGLRGHSV